MGKRGPPRQPQSVLKLSGSWKAKAREKHGVITVAPQAVEPPEWLHPEAAKHWQHFSELLFPLGLISSTFADDVAVLCVALEDFIRSSNAMMGEPSTIDTEKGSMINPVHKAYGESFARFIKALGQCGLTPAAMSSVTTALAGGESLNAYSLRLK